MFFARTSVPTLLAISCLTVTLAALAGGCADKRDVGDRATTSATAPLRDRPRTDAELPTTSGEIFVTNMNGEIAELTRISGQYPDAASNVRALAAALHGRGRFRGDLDEIQRGIDLASKCATMTPSSPACLLMRADQEQSLHRFPAAQADLERARALGAEPARMVGLQTELDWNAGRYDTAIPAIRHERVAHPSPSTWAREAILEHELGHEAEAERAFETAEDAITDTGPMFVAYVNLQRGIHRMQTGQLEKACAFFREAIARIPAYVAAREHLAEALHLLGKDAEATREYEEVVRVSSDPEFAHALGSLYRASGRTREGDALEAQAQKRYAELVARFPEAMYWHASEFYASIGDHRTALELLEKNAALRPNSTSFVALARAQHVSGQHDRAKASIDRALAMPLVSANLYWTAAKIYDQAGDKAKAASFHALALRINPRIEQLEP